MNGVTMMNGARNRTVLIMGVSKGLGKALALEIAKRGHTVIGCSCSQDELNSLQVELSSSSSQSESNASSSDNHLFMPVDVQEVIEEVDDSECNKSDPGKNQEEKEPNFGCSEIKVTDESESNKAGPSRNEEKALNFGCQKIKDVDDNLESNKAGSSEISDDTPECVRGWMEFLEKQDAEEAKKFEPELDDVLASLWRIINESGESHLDFEEDDTESFSSIKNDVDSDPKEEELFLVLREVFTLCSLERLVLVGKIGKLPEYRHDQLSTSLTRIALWSSGLTEDPMITLEKLPNLQALLFWDEAYVGKEMVCSAGGFP